MTLPRFCLISENIDTITDVEGGPRQLSFNLTEGEYYIQRKTGTERLRIFLDFNGEAIALRPDTKRGDKASIRLILHHN